MKKKAQRVLSTQQLQSIIGSGDRNMYDRQQERTNRDIKRDRNITPGRSITPGRNTSTSKGTTYSH